MNQPFRKPILTRFGNFRLTSFATRNFREPDASALDHMRASIGGRNELPARVRQALALPTKREAEMIFETVVAALEATLLNNLDTDGFTLKFGGFGKFSVRHKAGIRRKIGFSGETIQTKRLRKVKFIGLGNLRRQERVG